MNLAPILAPDEHRQHSLGFVFLDLSMQIVFEMITGILRRYGLDRSSIVSVITSLLCQASATGNFATW